MCADGGNNLQIHESRERGVYVRHVTELFMQDPEEVLAVMRNGAQRRSVATTSTCHCYRLRMSQTHDVISRSSC